MRPTRRRHRPLLATIAVLLALAAVPASASALAVSVTGDDGRPVAINPAAPPSIRNLQPAVAISADPTGRYSVAVTDPTGNAAASPVTCQDPTRPTNLQLPFRGNGRYTVTVTVFAAGDAGCTTPAAPATAFPFTIAGRVVVSQIGRFVLRDLGSATRKSLALPVNADPGSTVRDVRFASAAKLAKDGSIRGRTLRAVFKNGKATLAFPGPGTYTVVARDSASGHRTPWSAPVRIRVVAPFDLATLAYPDTSGPSFRILGHVRDLATTGTVSVALAKGNGVFRPLGRARIDRRGAFGAAFTAASAGTYHLRFTYRGNGLVTPGRITRSFRVGTAIVGT